MMNAYVMTLGFLQEQSHMLSLWAVQTGVMVSALIIAVLIIRRPFAKAFGARAAYALWLLPVARLVMPTVTVPAHWLFWTNSAPVQQIPMDVLSLDLTMPMTAMSSPEASLWSSIDWTLVFLSVWAIGAGLWLLWHGLGYRTARRELLGNSVAVDSKIETLAADCAAKLYLKHFPQLRSAKDNRGPMVMGLFAPIIILPHGFSQDFTHEQQRFALMHELAHIKRFDLWAAFAALVFRALNWPNPLVHYAMRAFRVDQEAACDASVLSMIDGDNNRQSYGETLLRAATLSQLNSGQKFTDVPIGLTLNHPLKERLMALKNPMKKTNWLTYTAATAAILAGCAMTAPYTVASAQDDVLAGAPAQNSQTMRQIMVVEKDGKVLVDEGYEIHIENGEAIAWEIDSTSGKRKRVDIQTLKDLDGFDFDISKDGIVSLSADRVVHIPHPPKLPNGVNAPIPPFWVTLNSGEQRHVFSAIADIDEYMETQIESGQIKIPKGMEMANTQARLAAAQSLLNSMADNDLPDARREIKKAQKALKEAEKALIKARAKQK